MTLSGPQIAFIAAMVTALYVGLGSQLHSACREIARRGNEIAELKRLVAEYQAARRYERDKLGRFAKR